ncbi:MAG TPA: DUF6159 family protein [Candidatus Thermoplasmatota archaeon]|nr:DUF6159 family protein [Candidatus Thermoplasmatota archaeon]
MSIAPQTGFSPYGGSPYGGTPYGGHRAQPGFFERLRIGWHLTKSAFGVLRMDKEILLLPVLSGIAMVLLLAASVGPFLFGLASGAVQGQGAFQTSFYVLLGVLYVGGAFITIFFNVAVIHCATIRFDGGDPTVRDGLSFAANNVGRIFVWALFVATVGMALRMLRERAGFLGQILLAGVEIAWGIATYFVVPILVYRQVGPVAAIKESAGLIRRTWGEGLAAVGSVGIITMLLMIPGFLLVVGSIFALAATRSFALFGVVLAMGILSILFVAVLQSALNGIVQSALYKYATTGRIPQAFDARDVNPYGAPTPVQARPY